MVKANNCMIDIESIKTSDSEEKMHIYWDYRSASFGFDFKALEEIKYKIKPYIMPSYKVLDIGAGTGVVSAAVASLGADVITTDISEKMLAEAQKNIEWMGLKSQNYICSTANHLPFDDNSFDVIISRNLTWALSDPEGALREWKRVIKPGGLLIYFDANQYTFWFYEEERKNRDKLIELMGAAHPERSGFEVDYSLCDETGKELPLSRYIRPKAWDEKVLPEYEFAIIKEDIEKPQNLLEFGIAKGWATEFMIVAKNIK